MAIHPDRAAHVAVSSPLLEVRDLRVGFETEKGFVNAVDGVSFRIDPGETVGIVGESGSGKSVTALTIMRLLSEPPARILGGTVLFNGRDLTRESPKFMRRVRGKEISMIFQEPMTSLNPLFTIGYQITESIRLHQGLRRKAAEEKAVELLRRVGVALPEKRVRSFPHQLSGGMRQRVMIAMAMACEPNLLIADEPTTALDVTIQAQILALMRRLRDEFGTSILLITHDLGVVAEMADRVVVMYGGQVMEEAPVDVIFSSPAHPYTLALLHSIPRMDREMETLHVIPGEVPSPFEFPKGCRFSNRCPFATQACVEEVPPIEETSPGHRVRCWHPQNRGDVA